MKKIFRVNFKIKCYCKGIYSYADAHISVPAEDEKEAIKIVKESTTFEIFSTEANDITPYTWNA